MSRQLALRGGLIVLGGLLLLRGAWLAVTDIPSVDRVHVVVWFAAGVVVHDGVLAPISVLLGRWALPHLPTSARWGARALLAWAATVLIIGLPLVRQDRHRSNPTIEFGHPFVGLCVALVLGIAAVAAAPLVSRVAAGRGRRGRPAATPRPADSRPPGHD